MTSPPSPSVPSLPDPRGSGSTHETEGRSTGIGSQSRETLAFPDPKNRPWWNSWWVRALGPEPSDGTSEPPQSLRFVTPNLKQQPVPLDLRWDQIGAPSPTWPPTFMPLWPEFEVFIRTGGMPSPLDPNNTWLIAAPSADKTLGHLPTLVSLPPDQAPLPGCTIVARRPQSQTVTQTFTVSPLGAFKLPPEDVLAAGPGASALGSALIGEVWRL